jgi:hypothetical protein
MEWAFGSFIVVMLGLYIWSATTTKREISKRIQPFVDDLFGTHPNQKGQSGQDKAPK